MQQPVAQLKAGVALKPAEAALVESVVISRPRGWLSRFRYALASAAKVVERAEFDRVCGTVAKDLDGQAIHPEDAAAKAKRVIEAYTQAQASVLCPKCDVSDQAILVCFLGDPKSGFLFQRAIKLKDPRTKNVR